MSLLVRIYYNAVFGGLGGLLGWMLFGIFGTRTPDAGLAQKLQMLLGGLDRLLVFTSQVVSPCQNSSVPANFGPTANGILNPIDASPDIARPDLDA